MRRLCEGVYVMYVMSGMRRERPCGKDARGGKTTPRLRSKPRSSPWPPLTSYWRGKGGLALTRIDSFTLEPFKPLF